MSVSALASDSVSGMPDWVVRLGSPELPRPRQRATGTLAPHADTDTAELGMAVKATAQDRQRQLVATPQTQDRHRLDQLCPGLVSAQAHLARLPETERGTSLMISNVAAKLVEQGRLSEAEALYREMLVVRRAKLGHKDPDTLAALGNLALNLRLQGKLAEAEPLCRESLAASREVLGSDVQDTIIDAGNFGKLLLEQGMLGEAEPLLVEAVTWWRKQHGNGGFCNGPLVELMREQGRLPEARQELGTLVEDMRAKFGPHHQAALEAEAISARLRIAIGLRALSVIATAVEPDGMGDGLADLRATIERMDELLGAAHPYTVKWQRVLGEIKAAADKAAADKAAADKAAAAEKER
jgi:hypothetical protein